MNGKNLEALQADMRRRNADRKLVERISQPAPEPKRRGRPPKPLPMAHLQPEPKPEPTAKTRGLYLHNDAMKYLEKLAEADDTTASHTLARLLKGLEKLGVWSAIDFVRNGIDPKAVSLLQKSDSPKFVM